MSKLHLPKAMVALVLGGSLAIAGCANQAEQMSQAEKAQQAVAKAEAAYQKTWEETGGWGAWKSTKGILGNARASLEQGDYQAAIEAAKEVRFQANKGLKQYREEQEQWQLAVKRADFPEQQWVTGQTGES